MSEQIGNAVIHEPSSGLEEAQVGGQASLWSDAWKQLRRNWFFLVGSVLLLAILVMAVFPSVYTRTDPRACDLSLSADSPSSAAWFGYDVFGCDLYANVVYGARNSIIIGVLTVFVSVVIGVVVGALAGYFGGWVDSLLARVTDVFYGLPLILGAILLLTSLPSVEWLPGFITDRTAYTVSLSLIVFGWMTMMRLVRATVLSVKDSDYVQAARALGASTWRIIVRHILPNAVAPVLVVATTAIGGIIAAEATLTYLGVGLQLPDFSWGLQINSGQNRLRGSPHLVLFPSLFLSLTVLSFILIGDALRDALDPKLR